MSISPHDSKSIEQDTKEKYSGKAYSPDSASRLFDIESKDYSNILLGIRMRLVERYADSADVLDVCCATGKHLLSLSSKITHGTGLDFSEPFIERAKEIKAIKGIRNVDFVLGNARSMRFDDSSFKVVYCFSALYYMPNVGEVIREIARVLRSGGKCILDMGNLYSLNTLVCNAYPELAYPCHIPVWEMKRILRMAGLDIIEHRVFQILPLWGERPWWLRPLLHSAWRRILQRQVHGKMLDEWISNLPVLKYIAFRHIFVCQKA